jgi:hypothetical protein
MTFFVAFLLSLGAGAVAVLSPPQAVWREPTLMIAGPVAVLFCCACIVVSAARAARATIILLFWTALAFALSVPMVHDKSYDLNLVRKRVSRIQPELSKVVSRGRNLLTAERS